jgi:ATP-dependent DNA helicase DinG
MSSFQEPPGFQDDGYLESLLSSDSEFSSPQTRYGVSPSVPEFHDRKSRDSGSEYRNGFRFQTQSSAELLGRTRHNADNTQVLSNFDLDDCSFNNPLEELIINIFREGGLLSRKTSFFRERRPQIDMVKAVITAVREKRNLVVEAGTGTGKTFAYLIPLLKLGRRVIVSTRTLNLQDQLIRRDTEHIKTLLENEYRVVVLKGRANYVCISRLKKMEQDGKKEYEGKNDVKVKSRQYISSIQKIRNFLDREESGDLSLLDFRDFEHDFIDRIAAHSYTCRGNKCKFAAQCYVNRARRMADDADLLIVNHSLLLQNYLRNFALFNSSPDVIVFDEGHHVPEVVRGTFTEESGSATIRKCCATLEELGDDNVYKGRKRNGRSFGDAVRDLCDNLDFLSRDISKDLYMETRKGSDTTSYDKGGRLSVLLSEVKSKHPEVIKVLRRLKIELEKLYAELKNLITDYSIEEEKGNPLKSLITAASDFFEEIINMADFFIESAEPSLVNVFLIVSTQNSFSLQSIPLDVSSIFPHKILNSGYPVKDCSDSTDDDYDEDDIDEDSESFVLNETFESDLDDEGDNGFSADDKDSSTQVTETVRIPVYVFTSATITSGNTFDKYCNWLGIENELHLKVNSPFDYSRQGFIYLPKFIPQGKVVGEEHSQQIVNYVLPLLKVIDGGFLILCTSLGTMSRVYSLLKNNSALNKRKLYCQSLTSKVEIVRNMLRYGDVVTVATSSFWEGVDIPGDGLSCVVIDRFPFKPMDTMQKAMSDYVTQVLHRNAFVDLSLPEMIISLKQGVGRLIRSENDFGVVAIADDRIVSGPSYGKRVLNELPPFAQTGSLDEISRQWQKHREISRARKNEDNISEEVEMEEYLKGIESDDKSVESWIEESDD